MAHQNGHQQQQQQQVVRSINCRVKSFVKFYNTTAYPVDLYWIDYEGRAVHYKRLNRWEHYDINTFVTHPWIFVERETKDRFLVNGSQIYFPEAGDVRERLERRISLPLYSLRELCLRAIKRRLRTDRNAYDLELPRMLQLELYYQKPRRIDRPIEDITDRDDDRRR